MGRIAVIAVIMLIAGCGGGPVSTKYTQTWVKPYGTTTCDDFTHAMDEHERFAMASDFLLSYQRKLDQKDAPIPNDAKIALFTGEISGLCSGEFLPTDPIADVAQAIYMTEHDRFKP